MNLLKRFNHWLKMRLMQWLGVPAMYEEIVKELGSAHTLAANNRTMLAQCASRLNHVEDLLSTLTEAGIDVHVRRGSPSYIIVFSQLGEGYISIMPIHTNSAREVVEIGRDIRKRYGFSRSRLPYHVRYSSGYERIHATRTQRVTL